MSIVERYSGEQITYSGDSIDGNQAIVRTKFLTKQGADKVPHETRQGGIDRLSDDAVWRSLVDL